MFVKEQNLYQIKVIKMEKNYVQSVKISHNHNQPYITGTPYRILIIGGSGSRKTNVLLNLIKYQRPDIDKIYLYVKDPFQSKNELLFNGGKKVRFENLKNPKTFIDYSKAVDYIYENLKDYDTMKKRRVLILFDYIIEDMESNKKLSHKVTELF